MYTLDYQNIITKSGQVGYIKLGNGDPLILIVGYSGTLFHWNKTFIFELAKYFTLYLIDNRKIGFSNSSNSENIHGLAEDVVDFIEAMKLKIPSILGWSMGGVITQELIKNYGHKINKVILLASVPKMKYVNLEFMQFLVNSSNYSNEEFKERLYAFFFSETQYAKTKNYIAANAIKMSNYHYRFTKEAKSLQDAIIPFWSGMTIKSLEEIDNPVLLMRARNDLVVSEESLDFMFMHISKSKIIAYPTGGHFLIHHNPIGVARDIVNFFDSKELK